MVQKSVLFLGTNLSSVFELPCIKSVLKSEKDEPILVMRVEKLAVGSPATVLKGDKIEEDFDGKWRVIRSINNQIYSKL